MRLGLFTLDIYRCSQQPLLPYVLFITMIPKTALIYIYRSDAYNTHQKINTNIFSTVQLLKFFDHQSRSLLYLSQVNAIPTCSIDELDHN